MHPIKSRNAIQKAYFDYGVRDFALDSPGELHKILEQTGYAKDLNLFVRLAVPNYYSEINLSGKFGINPDDAINLLRQTRKVTDKIGVCFHVGSQCMNPLAFANAINLAADILTKANISIEVLDIGGGFPTAYSNLKPPPLPAYMDEIRNSLSCYPSLRSAELICEAGRAMVAESASLLVKVELRKGNALYINDGIYGSLFEAGYQNFIYPVRLIRMSGDSVEKLLPFKFYGPTCDSADVMEGPFYLPGDVEEGDYIEIGQLGAYGRAFQSNFNGFASNQLVEVTDEPLLSIFDTPAEPIGIADEA
jgi:ornithine decarboxylase